MKLSLKGIRFKANFQHQNPKYFKSLANTLCLRCCRSSPRGPDVLLTLRSPAGTGSTGRRLPFWTPGAAALTFTPFFVPSAGFAPGAVSSFRRLAQEQREAWRWCLFAFTDEKWRLNFSGLLLVRAQSRAAPAAVPTLCPVTSSTSLFCSIFRSPTSVW